MLVQQYLVNRDYQYLIYDEVASETARLVVCGWDNAMQVELNHPKLIIDLGANVGIWSFYHAKKYPEATIVSVEPLQKNFTNLVHGISANHFSKVKPIQTAIHNTSQELTLRRHQGNSGAASAFIEPSELFIDEVVPAITLNTLFESLDSHVDLLKVDIEGAEYDIFQDFKHWDKLGAVTMELHPWPRFKTVSEQKERSDALIKLFQDNMPGRVIKYPYPQFHSYGFHEFADPGLRKLQPLYDEYNRHAKEIEQKSLLHVEV